MKNRPLAFLMALAVVTATAICLGAPLSTASAQSTSTTNTSPTTPPQVSAATPPAASTAQAPALPYGVGEVVKLYQGGINKDVIVNYINNTAPPYHLRVRA